MKRNPTRPRLLVTADGSNVVGHAGARLLSDLADATSLTEGLSAAMASTKGRRCGHDRGHVLVDVAVMIADGGEAISDLVVLRDQPDLFGNVASTPTAWRTLEAIGLSLDGSRTSGAPPATVKPRPGSPMATSTRSCSRRAWPPTGIWPRSH